jgi:hypothetical protein
MPHKSDARREIAWRYLRVKQPAELPALQIILVAVGESYRVLSGLCCVVPAVLTQKNAKINGCNGAGACNRQMEAELRSRWYASFKG